MDTVTLHIQTRKHKPADTLSPHNPRRLHKTPTRPLEVPRECLGVPLHRPRYRQRLVPHGYGWTLATGRTLEGGDEADGVPVPDALALEVGGTDVLVLRGGQKNREQLIGVLSLSDTDDESAEVIRWPVGNSLRNKVR